LRAEAAEKGESYRARWGWVSYGNGRRRSAAADGDAIDRDVLGDRDGWVCGLCRLPVDRELAYPAPLSASIDHVVPLKLGGGHVWPNVQIAHNRCNVSKKANAEWKPGEVA
jgi:5-methylcytosine-specific restriction endonuclease McrA